MTDPDPENKSNLLPNEHQRNEEILADTRNLCLLMEIKDVPSRIVWSSLFPHWGAVDLDLPLIIDHEVVIHKALKTLTNDELKPLIASSLARRWKTGKYSKLVSLTILCSMFAILVSSFVLLPLVLPQRVPITCRTCPVGYGPLGDAVTIYVEPIILIFLVIFLGRNYNRHRTHRADRQATTILGKDAVIASFRAILASIPKPPARSKRVSDRQTRRRLNEVERRVRVLQSTQPPSRATNPPDSG